MNSTTLSGVQIISVVIGVVLPIIVGIVTKEVTSDRVKSILLLFFSGVSGFLTQWVNNTDGFVWQQALLTTLVTFVTGVATLYGFWNPTGVTTKVQRFTLIRGGKKDGLYKRNRNAA